MSSPVADDFVPAGRDPELHVCPDLTGSNDQLVDNSNPRSGPRTTLVNDMMAYMVQKLASREALQTTDPEALDEAVDDPEAAPGEFAGGLKMFPWRDGRVFPMDDLNTSNFKRKWHPTFGGGTYLSPALAASYKDFQQEGQEKGWFERPAERRPILVDIITTDGQLDRRDKPRVHAILSGASEDRRFVLIVYGDGPDHEAALEDWKAIEKSNQYVKVYALTASTNFKPVIDQVLSIVQ